MNCQEVQLQFSGYLEKSLDAIRMKGIESHLSSCPFCRAELHGLSDCIKWVSNLPLVNPPAGFTERVMAHVREIEPQPGPWQRFLGNIRTAVPLQAAAVVLVSVLAMLLYQRQAPVSNFNSTESVAPSEGDQTVAKDSPVKARESVLASRRPARGADPVVESAPQTVAQKRAQAPAGVPAKDHVATPQSAPATAQETAKREIPEHQSIVSRRPIQAQEVSTASEPSTPGAEALGIGAAIGALSRSPFHASRFRAERALSPLSEPSPDFEFIVKRRPRARAEAEETFRRRSEATTVATGASERSVAPSVPTPNQVVEIRWFTVAPEHYGQFRNDLAAEAIIDAERPLAAKERDFGLTHPRELLIKVTILPADR